MVSNVMALIQEYFELSHKYQQEYGTHTILLMQVGSFFEVYGNKTNRIIDDFTRICELNIAEKSTSQMAGFKDMQLEKYLKKIQEAGYTAVVYIQDETKTHRKLAGVFSPGTYFSDSPVLSNHITCIWVDQVNRLFPKGKYVVVGVASIDIYTGKSSIMEYTEEYFMNPTTFDELERFISITNPNEAILISNLGLQEMDKIIHFAGIQCDLIHRIPITKEDTVIMKRVHNCEKQTYQKELMTIHPDHPIATQAYCYLLDFVRQHNPHLTHAMSEPEWENPNRLVLANHTLKQLNMIDDGAVKPNKLSCIASMLNDCSTPMGKRAFLHVLLNPIVDPVLLQREYDIIEHVMDKTISLHVKDLSKWERKLFLKKTTIASFVTLKQDMETVKRVDVDDVEMTYLRHFDTNMDNVASYTEEIIHFIDSHFEGETIRAGVDEKYDRQRTRLEEAEVSLKKIQEQFNQLLEQKEKKKSEYVKIHETEKNSIGLICTKRRAALLMKMTSLTTEVQSGSNVYLLNPDIQTLCKTITTLRTTIEKEKDRVFWMIVERMEAYQSKVDTIIVYVTRLDLMYTRASLARRYKYCKPTLVHAEKSFVDAKQLRHALIEQLQTSELYVTNDVSLGTGTDGILLYGTNAVGKTSFIRALGIAVILAQAGMYVPCTSFHYKPYHSLFTRIIGNDNLFKGLSTFAVEMSELRTILKLANQNSLILGDELCSGTETQSAISIFVAGIQQFHREKSSFLFATHLHEIVDYDELQLDTVKMKHMSVIYDRATGVLVYDRKLKDGPGDNMYGLEVCKSLSLPPDFITSAYAIRQKYKPDSILSLKPSRYNAKKLMGPCEQCGKPGKEIHHLQYQEDAMDGFIQTDDAVFPKNHLANLMSLCEKCHDVIHQKKTRMKKVKTSKGITHVNV
jgi:DNA mismatch repair protein MutS